MALGQTISIAQLMRAIRRLPPDEPHIDPSKWYKTQKEHWLGWLSEYHGPDAYGRRSDNKRDAEFAYNHIVEPKMLLWLIETAGVKPRTWSTLLDVLPQKLGLCSRSPQLYGDVYPGKNWLARFGAAT